MPPIDEKSILNYENDVEYFASSMHSLFSNLNVKEEVYSMGRLSSIVAEKLSNLPAAINRRKVHKLLYLLLMYKFSKILRFTSFFKN